MEENNYKIVRVCKENLKDLVFLFYEVRKVKIPIEYFEKKFNTSFSGCSYIGYFAYDSNNIPTAFCGVFPCMLNIKGEQILSAQIGDLITHTAHQRKGLFKILFRHVTELAQKEGVKLLFTFPLPDSNSYKGFVNKLGLVKTENLENYSIPVFSFPIYKICAKLRRMNLYRWYLKFILSFIEETDELTNSVNNSGFDFVDRDKAFYAYKKYEKNYLINYSGLKIWFKIDDGLFIGDIELNDLNFDKYIKKLKSLSFLLGLHCIKFTQSSQLPWSEKLKIKYPVTERAAVCFYSFNKFIDTDKIKFTAGDLDTF